MAYNWKKHLKSKKTKENTTDKLGFFNKRKLSKAQLEAEMEILDAKTKSRIAYWEKNETQNKADTSQIKISTGDKPAPTMSLKQVMASIPQDEKTLGMSMFAWVVDNYGELLIPQLLGGLQTGKISQEKSSQNLPPDEKAEETSTNSLTEDEKIIKFINKLPNKQRTAYLQQAKRILENFPELENEKLENIQK